MKRLAFYGIVIIILLAVIGDHMMRLDQLNLCIKGDMPCPDALWIWEKL